jgi:hypothetical protein
MSGEPQLLSGGSTDPEEPSSDGEACGAHRLCALVGQLDSQLQSALDWVVRALEVEEQAPDAAVQCYVQAQAAVAAGLSLHLPCLANEARATSATGLKTCAPAGMLDDAAVQLLDEVCATREQALNWHANCRRALACPSQCNAGVDRLCTDLP